MPGLVSNMAVDLAEFAFGKGTVNRVKQAGKKYAGDDIDQAILQNAQHDYDKLLKSSGIDGDMEKMKAHADYGKVSNALKSAQDVAGRRKADAVKEMGGTAKDWLTGADLKAAGKNRTWGLAKRYGGMAAGSVAAGTALRTVGGGSLMYDSRGNRDIAGIPMI